MRFLDELKFRGLLNEIDEGAKERLDSGEMLTGYIGTDPTTAQMIINENGEKEKISSLHLGHLCAFMIASIFHKHGHKPIILVGSATSSLGDPSYRENAREMMTYEQINKNAKNIKNQLSKLFDFNSETENAPILVDNREWVNDVKFLDFARDTCQYITVNYLLAKESMKKRLESGLTITELLYPILQSYDYWHLNNNYGCEFQFGGSDQQGTIMTSLELIRKKEGKNVHFITCPLVTDSTGKKIGKSEGNASVYLDRRLTSPYKMYQYFINSSDEMAEKMIKIFSAKEIDEIEELIHEHKENPSNRILQKALAEEIVTLIHSKADYENAVQASNALFSKDIESIVKLDLRTFNEVFEGVNQYEITKEELEGEGINIAEFLSVKTNILNSKASVRKAIQNNAISINKVKINDANRNITVNDIVDNRFILIQNGKKNTNLIKIR